ncbi:porin [Pasteurella oralis]|uniref:porin n=1 Tax=Pasteurella oralis TaxID=1071947 RepID=UPI000C7D684A|nr:porin [Pasteurella oralis]
MKKTLITLAITAVTATSVSAATVYEQDGTKVEVGGSVRLVLGKFGDNQRGDLRNDDSRLEVKASHNLGNGLSALGGLEIRFGQGVESTSDSIGNPTVDKLYAGFTYEPIGTLTFGKQTTNGDDVQLGDYAYTFGGNNNLPEDAGKSVKFRSAEWHGFSFGADYLFGNAKKKTQLAAQSDYKYGYGVAVFYNRELMQDLVFNLNAGYSVDTQDNGYTYRPTATSNKRSMWRVATEVSYGPAALAAEYGQTRLEFLDTFNSKSKHILVGAKYQVMEPSKVYLQWQRNQDIDASNNKITEQVYLAGVDYQFHKNVVTYVEYANVRSRDNMYPVTKERDNKYGVGLRVFF